MRRALDPITRRNRAESRGACRTLGKLQKLALICGACASPFCTVSKLALDLHTRSSLALKPTLLFPISASCSKTVGTTKKLVSGEDIKLLTVHATLGCIQPRRGRPDHGLFLLMAEELTRVHAF